MSKKLLRTDSDITSIVEKYKNTVYSIAMTRVKNRNDADDVFQEVFLVYFRKKIDFNDEQHQKAWLINTTINCSKKFISNKFKQKNTSLEDLTATQNIPENTYELNTNEESTIYKSLCELPLKYRTVLHLYYFEDMNVELISQTLKIKSGTIRIQMNRGREMLREKLKGEYDFE